jgi:hypothetical protein
MKDFSTFIGQIKEDIFQGADAEEVASRKDTISAASAQLIEEGKAICAEIGLEFKQAKTYYEGNPNFLVKAFNIFSYGGGVITRSFTEEGAREILEALNKNSYVVYRGKEYTMSEGAYDIPFTTLKRMRGTMKKKARGK